MRSACVLVFFAAASLALGVATALADPGGNSGAAHQCKQTPGNSGHCVSDAAHDGTATAAPSSAGAQATTTTAAQPAVGAAPANNSGNSAAAHQCQHGGWKNLVRADQTKFKNAGACVSYAAHGGTPAAPKPQAQVLCESFAGVFAQGSGNTLWTCTYNIAGNTQRFVTLAAQCFADVRAEGGTSAQFGFVSGNLAGVRTDACMRF